MGRQRLLQELTLTLWGYSETKLLKHIIIRFKTLLEMNMLLSIEPLLSTFCLEYFYVFWVHISFYDICGLHHSTYHTTVSFED